MYSIKQVSEQLGIPAVTIRAWENRYKVIDPTRTEGGHRLYSEKDLQTLQWLKNQVHENGLKISEAVRLLEKNYTKTSAAPPSKNGQFNELKDQLYSALVNLESQTANQIVDLAFSLFDYEEVCHHLFVPVLYKVGDEWEKGIISVAQEHFASQFIISRCTQLLRILPVNPLLPKALAFCPQGEHHQIGLMLFGLFLAKKGHDVIYLGPNTPMEGLDEVVKLKDISIIAISMTNPEPVSKVANWIRSILQKNPDLKFIVGGNCVHHFPKLNPKSVTCSVGSDWEDWYASL